MSGTTGQAMKENFLTVLRPLGYGGTLELRLLLIALQKGGYDFPQVRETTEVYGGSGGAEISSTVYQLEARARKNDSLLILARSQSKSGLLLNGERLAEIAGLIRRTSLDKDSERPEPKMAVAQSAGQQPQPEDATPYGRRLLRAQKVIEVLERAGVLPEQAEPVLAALSDAGMVIVPTRAPDEEDDQKLGGSIWNREQVWEGGDEFAVQVEVSQIRYGERGVPLPASVELVSPAWTNEEARCTVEEQRMVVTPELLDSLASALRATGSI